MLYGRQKLIEWAGNGGVTPFNPDMISDRENEHCIDLSIGLVHDGQIDTLPKEPDCDESVFVIEPLQWRLGLIQEYLRIPGNAIGEFTIRSCFAKRGLGQALSKDIKAGWQGYLVVELFNYSPIPIALNKGDRIGQISVQLIFY